METDLVPSEMIKTFARKWWILVAAMVVGGLAGMLVTRAHKPVYQSQAVITTAVDYAYTGHLEDFELDQLIMGVGELIDSTGIREGVVNSITAEYNSDAAGKQLKNMDAVRKGYTWLLTVRATDPNLAQRAANIWANQALTALVERRSAAQDAYHIHAAQLALEECQSRVVALEPVTAGCSDQVIAELKTYLETQDVDNSALTERKMILLSNLSFELTREPQIPASPELFRQDFNTLAGAMTGLIAALVVLFQGKTKAK